ncbi:MAG: glycosyltransferase family 39 protein [Anaerolineae bacterium]|nr:glycosyltransferase family 39 protein [Anaerolineae bacterium]
MAETIERARGYLAVILSRWARPGGHAASTACIILTLLLGFGLRLVSWDGNPLHPDEALYAHWARLAASGRDLALLSVPVDKPPLFTYIVAFAFRILGPGVAVARFPSVLASVLSLPILFTLARALYGRSVALLALVLYATSPFAISFAPTAFTDPLLVMWGLLACLLAVRGRWVGAGLALGLAVATKQQGLLFVPLVWGLGRIAPRREGQARGRPWRFYPLLAAEGALPLPVVTVPPPIPFARSFKENTDSNGALTVRAGFPLTPACLVGLRRLGASDGTLRGLPSPQRGEGERSSSTLSPKGRGKESPVSVPSAGGDILNGRDAILAARGQRRTCLRGFLKRPAHRLETDGKRVRKPALRVSCTYQPSDFIRWLRLLIGFLPIFALLTWWDSLRWHVWPSFWERSWIAYGGLRLTVPGEWGERACDWAELLAYLVASPWLTLVLLLSIALLLGAAWASRRHLTGAARADLVVLGYGASFLLLHGLVSFQPWDRYLVPLAPLAVLLLARGLLFPLTWTKSRAYLAGLILFLLVTLPGPARNAALSRLPVGGDHGAYAGLEQVAAWVRTQLPADATLYHQDLGWHLAYYLFDGGPEARWYADPTALAEDIQRRSRPAYVILSSQASAGGVDTTLALHDMGMALMYGVTVNEETAFTLYEIVRGVNP